MEFYATNKLSMDGKEIEKSMLEIFKWALIACFDHMKDDLLDDNFPPCNSNEPV